MLDDYMRARDAETPPGSGAAPAESSADSDAPCPKCKGEGRVEAFDARALVRTRACRDCRGTGKAKHEHLPASPQFLRELAFSGPTMTRIINRKGELTRPCSARCGALSGGICFACGARSVVEPL